jgi:hypothetical protein
MGQVCLSLIIKKTLTWIGNKDEEGLNGDKRKAAAGPVTCSAPQVLFAGNFLLFLSHQSLPIQFQNG